MDNLTGKLAPIGSLNGKLASIGGLDGKLSSRNGQTATNENLIIEDNILKRSSVSSGNIIYNSAYATATVNNLIQNTEYNFIILIKEGADVTGHAIGIHAYDKNGNWIGRIYSFSPLSNKTKTIFISDDVGKIVIAYPFNVADVFLYVQNSVDILLREKVTNLEKKVYPTINLKKNNPLLVSEIINVAETYYNHRNDTVNGVLTMVYGGTTVLDNAFLQGGNSIDCSTFIGLIYRGIPYENTVYGKPNEINDPDSYVANSDYIWSVNLYDYKEKIEASSTQPKKVRTASQMAEFMVNQGYSIVSTDNDYINVEPGDIVFYAAKDASGYKNEYRYLYISHVAMCISKTKNPAGSTYPWSHQIINVVHEDPCIKKQELETVWADQIALIVRPDLGSIGYDGTKLTLGNTILTEEQLIALLNLIANNNK